jgi:hypothetical protein
MVGRSGSRDRQNKIRRSTKQDKVVDKSGL